MKTGQLLLAVLIAVGVDLVQIIFMEAFALMLKLINFCL